MSITTRHSTCVHTGTQLGPQWRRLIDELARHGILGCPGATALLSTGIAVPRSEVVAPARDTP